MKKQDVIDNFSKMVSSLLEQGYTFNSQMMSGSQGEVIKVGLQKDNDGIALSIFFKDVEYEGHPFDRFEDSLVLYLETFNVSDWRAEDYSYWFGKERPYKNIKEIVYYNISAKVYDRDNNWYTMSKYEAVKSKEKKQARREARYESRKRNQNKQISAPGSKALALKIAKRIPGYKHAKIEDIESIYKYNNGWSDIAYFINFNRQVSKSVSLKLCLDENLQKVD